MWGGEYEASRLFIVLALKEMTQEPFVGYIERNVITICSAELF